MFVNYVLAFLEETFQSFPSTDVLKAIVEDRGEEEIIMQLINCFGGKGGTHITPPGLGFRIPLDITGQTFQWL